MDCGVLIPRTLAAFTLIVNSKPLRAWYRFRKQFDSLRRNLGSHSICNARDISTGARQAGDESLPDGISGKAHDDGDRLRRILCGGDGVRPHGNNDVDGDLHQLSCETRKSVETALGVSPLHYEVLAF